MAPRERGFRRLDNDQGIETRSAFWRKPARWSHAERSLVLDGGKRRIAYSDCTLKLVGQVGTVSARGFDQSSDRHAWGLAKPVHSNRLRKQLQPQVRLSIDGGPYRLLYQGAYANELVAGLAEKGVTVERDVE